MTVTGETRYTHTYLVSRLSIQRNICHDTYVKDYIVRQEFHLSIKSIKKGQRISNTTTLNKGNKKNVVNILSVYVLVTTKQMTTEIILQISY